MARRNETGSSSSGRRGSSRSNSGGKSSSGRGKSTGKSFKKSDSAKGSFGRDSGRPSSGKPRFGKPSSGRDDKSSFGKKTEGSSQGPRGERPFKKFDKPYGKKREGSSDSRKGSFGNERPGFAKTPKKYFRKKDEGSASSPRSFGNKREGFSKDTKRPYKKFDSDDRGKKGGDFSQGSRGEGSFKRPGKPFRSRDEAAAGSSGRSLGVKGEGFSRDSKRPRKKFDPETRGKEGGDFSQSPRGESSFKRPGKPFRSRDGRSSGSSGRSFGNKREGFSKDTKRPYKKPDSDRGDKPFKNNEGDRPFRGKPGEEKPEGSRESPGFFKKSKSRYSEKPRKSKEVREETAAPTQTEKIRLNKYIANSGVCSRREADELITMGLITVNGKTISELGYKVNPGDEVRYENRVLTAEKPVYILMNKPKGYLTTTDDPQERNTVMQIIGNAVTQRIYPVGRLDRNTTGLLLLTNDGELAEKLMHPSYNVKKIYKVELDRPLTKADFQTISEGVVLEEGRAMVDDLAIISEDSKTVGMELHIGWNRVVRRIFESLGYDVVRLDRAVYAGLDKKDLGRGEWRFLTKEELIRLKHYK